MDFSVKLRDFDKVWRRVESSKKENDSMRPVAIMPGKKKKPRNTRFLAR